jgi:hypothetical protein
MVMDIFSEEAGLRTSESQGVFFASLKVSIECLDALPHAE